jgi:hypothetical protein
MVQSAASQRQPPIEIQREALNKRYGELAIEYATVNQELGYLNGSGKLHKEREAEGILQQMKEVDAKLKALDVDSFDRNRQHLNLEEELQKIDFTEVKEVVRKIISQFGRDGGNASFLLQRNLQMAGRLCLLEIKDQLRSETRDFKTYPVEFSADSELNHIGLLNRLAGHLGVEPVGDPMEISLSIQRAIEGSLQSGSIVLIEIHKWEALPLPVQRQVLCWFLEQFWQPLVAQLPTIATTYSKVRFITVLVVEDELAPDCLEFCCTHDEFDGQKIIDLPLQDWAVGDILDWLDYLGLAKQQSEALAQRIHKASRGGIPELVCSALRRENFQNPV